MGRLDPEARMTIKALSARGATRSEVARLLGVTEGAVRYHARRMASGTADGRSRQKPAAEARGRSPRPRRSPGRSGTGARGRARRA